ncbi:phytoene/squalene synthase family protein [Nonomuraea polychroma]|uniref:phytoene/squalene synthase family protein n=1 Tax=Nonomuraea polychroma TaxID=46176 RepID=UPI003D914218
MTARELDVAGITGPVRTGYLVAGRLLEAKAKARGAAPVIRYLMPPHKRPYIELLFAFITYLDDIVDDPSHSVDVRLRRLGDLRAAFATAIDGDQPPISANSSRDERVNTELARSFVHLMRTWQLPLSEVGDFLDRQKNILSQNSYPTHEALEKEYLDAMWPPAKWANQVLEPNTAESDMLCRNATTSFQLIDFLLDLREDMELDRLYLPLEHLIDFGLDRESLERQLRRGPLSPQLRELIAFEAKRADDLLSSALDWPKTLHVTSRPFVEWDIAINRLKLAELRAGRLDDLIRRSVTSRPFKIKALSRTFFGIARALNAHRKLQLGVR